MPDFRIVDQSQTAQQLANAPTAGRGAALPWRATPPGKSFIIPLDTANVAGLRSSMARLRKEGMNFRMVKHAEGNILEIARYPDTVVSITVVEDTTGENG